MLLILRVFLRIVIALAIWAALLLSAAGTISWGRAWLHVVLWLAIFTVNFSVLLPSHRDVLIARLRPKRSTERSDALILLFFLLASLAMPLLAGFDAVRYGWFPLPLWTIYPGVVLHAAGDALLLWTMTANPFLEKTVRVQTERGHHVITTGPYGFVRHPMYVAVSLLFLGIPLVLGSLLTFVPVLVMILLLVVRIPLEERLLLRDLPGYQEYTHQTHNRFIPGIW